MKRGKNIYFASDFHLGVPNESSSAEREKRIIRWLDSIRPTTEELFLVGDVFDFWFEYKHAIPRGFVRLQAKIAEFTDAGIPVHWFTGNHDMWIFDYIPKELGVTLHRAPVERNFNGKHFYIGHGDGLGPGDYGYKFIKKVFANPLCQWLFARLHPNFGVGLANYFSKSSRASGAEKDEVYLGKEKEWLAIYAEEQLSKTPSIDYFVFGHRHLPIDIALSNAKSRYINLGEWIKFNSYAVFDGHKLQLKAFENEGFRYYS